MMLKMATLMNHTDHKDYNNQGNHHDLIKYHGLQKIKKPLHMQMMKLWTRLARGGCFATNLEDKAISRSIVQLQIMAKAKARLGLPKEAAKEVVNQMTMAKEAGKANGKVLGTTFAIEKS